MKHVNKHQTTQDTEKTFTR